MLILAVTLPLLSNNCEQVFTEMCESGIVDGCESFLEYCHHETLIKSKPSDPQLYKIIVRVKKYNRGVSDWLLPHLISQMCDDIEIIDNANYFSYTAFDSNYENTYTMNDLIVRQKINEDYNRKVLTAHKNNIEDIYKRLDKLWGETAIGIAYVDKQIQLSGMNDFYSMLFQLKNEIEPFLDKEILFERDVQPTH